MRYSPYDSDLKALAQMTEAQMLEYFILRIVESEEVWSLSDGVEWIVEKDNDQQILSLWPYEQLISPNLLSDSIKKDATSLEVFMVDILELAIEEDWNLNIMPGVSQKECLVTPHRLLDILEGIQDAAQYTLDG